MPERVLQGAPASPGVAFGPAWRRTPKGQPARVAGGAAEQRQAALDALAAAARELAELAATLPADEAAIIEAGALMAADPALHASVTAEILERGASAPEAILRATEAHAEAIAAIDDELLAARAADVRSLGQRAVRGLTNGRDKPPPGADAILIARDLGPADVAELAGEIAGIALSGSGATAHAAIVSRSLGIPLVASVGDALLAVPDGTPLALDGDSGELAVDPAPARAGAARQAMQTRRRASDTARAQRDEPARTRDGVSIAVLANVASAAELEMALAAGAEGIGLLRTELAFLEAPEWPSEEDHVAALTPILERLGRGKAIVRVLDFGADKSPPFLAGTRARGLELLLEHPAALLAQLRAILIAGRGRDVRVLVPLVDTADQLERTRTLLANAATELGVDPVPSLGAMVETPEAVENADALAAGAAFLSIGTNDLTATMLGADRFASSGARAHDPLVLRSIARAVHAAHDAGLLIEVCGEAASDPRLVPLLVGLGVDELSVGAARVATVRRWIRLLSAGEAAGLARSALTCDDAHEVELAVAPLARELRSAELGDEVSQSRDGGGRVLSLGA